MLLHRIMHWFFAGVITAVDDTYYGIQAPSEDVQRHTDHKLNQGLHLQCISGPDKQFYDAFTGYPGLLNIFKNLSNK